MIQTRDRTWFDTLGIAGCAFMLYQQTAAPDLYYTDCGELAAVFATLGVAHPTGYPLLTIIGYLWQLLPLPLTTIGKLNVLMAVLTSIAIAVVHRMLLHWLPQWCGLLMRDCRIVAAIGALLLATARTLWQQALSIEVHALQMLLIVSMLYWLLRWQQRRNPLHLYAAALVLGLCFANHLTAIVLIPGVVVFVLRVESGSWRQRLHRLRIPALINLSCALFYAYLPLRSATEPLFNWGEVHRSVDKFLYHVLGKQYSVWMFTGTMGQQLTLFGSLLLPNVALPLALWGMWVLWRRQRAVAVLLVLVVVVCVGYVSNYSIPDIEPYFVSAFVALNIAAVAGIAVLWRYVPVRAVVSVLPVVYAIWNWNANDLRNHWLVREYVKFIVDPLPQGSIVLSQQWDYFCSAFWYMQQVEGYRRDVVLIEKELLRRTWYIHQLRRWYGEPIERCQTEIAAYLPLLEEFESGKMPRQRYPVIQRAFVALLRAFLERNPERWAFATPEVLETEPDLASSVQQIPYGTTVALATTDKPLPPLPVCPHLERLLESSRRYNRERLDRGLLQIASFSLVQLGDLYQQRDPHKRAQALSCYQAALVLNSRNHIAAERLAQVGVSGAN